MRSEERYWLRNLIISSESSEASHSSSPIMLLPCFETPPVGYHPVGDKGYAVQEDEPKLTAAPTLVVPKQMTYCSVGGGLKHGSPGAKWDGAFGLVPHEHP